MAMYFSPRRLAAAAISSIVAVPSVHVLCMCRSPRMSSELDQAGQFAGVGPVELAAGLAQLGRKAGQVQRGVDLLFRPPGDLLLAAEDAVLVDLQPARPWPGRGARCCAPSSR